MDKEEIREVALEMFANNELPVDSLEECVTTVLRFGFKKLDPSVEDRELTYEVLKKEIKAMREAENERRFEDWVYDSTDAWSGGIAENH